jgi:hypothetical protein
MNRDAANEHGRPNQRGATVIRNSHPSVSAIHMNNDVLDGLWN